tara:strand:+ start:97679 stop:97873 length:195 start_codon:yes stop_codon:yes gene_type:complete
LPKLYGKIADAVFRPDWQTAQFCGFSKKNGAILIFHAKIFGNCTINDQLMFLDQYAAENLLTSA